MAGKRLTIAGMDARAEALEECADHLGNNWTDDAMERGELGRNAPAG